MSAPAPVPARYRMQRLLVTIAVLVLFFAASGVALFMGDGEGPWPMALILMAAPVAFFTQIGLSIWQERRHPEDIPERHRVLTMVRDCPVTCPLLLLCILGVLTTVELATFKVFTHPQLDPFLAVLGGTTLVLCVVLAIRTSAKNKDRERQGADTSTATVDEDKVD